MLLNDGRLMGGELLSVRDSARIAISSKDLTPQRKDMASGGYFYRMVAEGIGKGKVFQSVMKMIVVR